MTIYLLAAIEKLNFLLKGLEAYLPIEAIQFNLQKNPHLIKQQTAFTETDITDLTSKLLASGLSQEDIDDLLKTELYKGRKNLLQDGHN
ncbi:hypothetical protein [Mucilaginibacter sp.]|uniref:hypothetical protein n=1 Tax=Mucilaginibacter sp. TaxID=1882438 RepID=UPI003B001D3A